MQPNPRIPDPMGMLMAERVREATEPVARIRAELDAIDGAHASAAVRAALRDLSAAVDGLGAALAAAVVGADESPPRRLGHR